MEAGLRFTEVDPLILDHAAGAWVWTAADGGKAKSDSDDSLHVSSSGLYKPNFGVDQQKTDRNIIAQNVDKIKG
jgi:hypothetical protein